MNRTTQYILAVLVFFGCAGRIAGQSSAPEAFGMDAVDLPKGLVEGEFAPDFAGTTQTGKRIVLSEMLEDGPVVLLFYRGYWCPKCDRHLSALQDSLVQLTDLGLQVVAVAPEGVEGVYKTTSKVKATFHVISDPGGEIMQSYDVDFRVTDDYQKRILDGKGVDIARNNASVEARLPVPATFIISTDQEIFWRHFDWDYGQRASVRDILEAVKPRY